MKRDTILSIKLPTAAGQMEDYAVREPKQFDKPYNGTGALIIMRAAPEDIARHCNSERTALLGCAVGSRNRDHCTIYMADDEALKKYNQDYEIVYRHERGHCNGWSHGLGQ